MSNPFEAYALDTLQHMERDAEHIGRALADFAHVLNGLPRPCTEFEDMIHSFAVAFSAALGDEIDPVLRQFREELEWKQARPV